MSDPDRFFFQSIPLFVRSERKGCKIYPVKRANHILQKNKINHYIQKYFTITI